MLNYEITLYNPGDNKKKSKNLILALFFALVCSFTIIFMKDRKL